MQINLFDQYYQYYIGQVIVQCWLKTLSLASEDKNDAESRNSAATVRTSKEIFWSQGFQVYRSI